MSWLPAFPADITPFLYGAALIAVVMLLWDTVEVGRNDAANLVNAVFGSRVMKRRAAVLLAGVGVVIGATFSSEVMETARKGIFNPGNLAQSGADWKDGLILVLTVYISVYIVDTVLLYGYSAFGMPVSTTACLVFELLGASLALSLLKNGSNIVSWDKAGEVTLGIVCSIIVAGIAGYAIQRVMRGVFGREGQLIARIRTHGAWAGGGLVAGLLYFMIVKGMSKVGWVKALKDGAGGFSEQMGLGSWAGALVLIVGIWLIASMIIQASLVAYRETASRKLFPVLTVTGMFCMAVAFGQNDVANCAAPGLGAMNLMAHVGPDGMSKADAETTNREAVGYASKATIPFWALGLCGLLMAVGMTTRNAERVTRAEVRTGSMSDSVKLYAPGWCKALGRLMARKRNDGDTAAPNRKQERVGDLSCMRCHAPLEGKRVTDNCPCGTPVAQSVEEHTPDYDSLRAAVILSVSASVIAFASGRGLPVSTTYVAFAAVVATGVADRVFTRGSADLKIARTIWTVFSWFAASVVAAVATGGMAILIYKLGVAGMVIGIGLNLTVRYLLQRRSDAQEEAIAAPLPSKPISTPISGLVMGAMARDREPVEA